MILNPDCIRDIMLHLESRTSAGLIDVADHKKQGFSALSPRLLCNVNELEQYNYSELLYHTLQLSESGYIVTNFQFDPKSCSPEFTLTAIYYITPKGHEFIAKIKSDNVWNKKIKPLFNSFGSISLSIIEAIASGTATALINKGLTSEP